MDMSCYTGAADVIRARLGEAETGIVLGSGLGDFAQRVESAAFLPYEEIPGLPRSTAPGHEGRWWRGLVNGRPVFLLQGRFHAYEGYDLEQVTMYVRVMKLLGVRTLILTNAAGCVNTAWHPGDLMMLTDCINLSGRNPLAGPNLDAFGPRFPDMSEAYSRELRDICRAQAEALGITLREGVYCWFNGPSYETPAEIRMARILGVDAVGMSTVPETLVARHCGMRVLGLSCLTNMAAGILPVPLSHAEVTEAASRVKDAFSALLTRVVEALP